MQYWWSGPVCGLGNRLIAFAAVKACAGEYIIRFPWSDDPSCPGRFEEVFETRSNFAPAPAPLDDDVILNTHGWEPLTIYGQLNEALQLNLTLEEFCRKFVSELRSLEIRDDLKSAVRGWRSGCKGGLLGVHLRRTDRTALHRDQFRAFLLRRQGLNRELPFYLSAMYGLLPSRFVSEYENRVLLSSMRKYKSAKPDARYAVLSDDEAERSTFQIAVPRPDQTDWCFSGDDVLLVNKLDANKSGLRRSGVAHAMSDLLKLSTCDAIAQSNRASTFSIVAAIMGATPILTPAPRYPFWQAIEESTGLAPNNPRLSDV